VQRAAEMPVGGVKESHRRTVGRPSDKTAAARPGDTEQVRTVIQRVSSASVAVDGAVVGEIGAGLLVLVGVKVDDGVEQAHALASKIYTLRILDGELSAQDLGAPLLVISQFTLYADTRKGRRPSWNAAAPGPVAEPLVDAVVERLRQLGASVSTGIFGAQMQVSLVNDGPFTLIVDT
jgi:D-tyrosyl-tRNA(Tyr) deacylase